MNNELTHYGVKGMRWGQRRAAGAAIKTAKKAYKGERRELFKKGMKINSTTRQMKDELKALKGNPLTAARRIRESRAKRHGEAVANAFDSSIAKSQFKRNKLNAIAKNSSGVSSKTAAKLQKKQSIEKAKMENLKRKSKIQKTYFDKTAKEQRRFVDAENRKITSDENLSKLLDSSAQYRRAKKKAKTTYKAATKKVKHSDNSLEMYGVQNDFWYSN